MLEDSANRVCPRHVDSGDVSADTGRLTDVCLDKFRSPQRSIGEAISARKVGLVDFSLGKICLDKG